MNMISPSGIYDYGASNAITAASLLEPKPRTHPKPMSKQKTLKYKSLSLNLSLNIYLHWFSVNSEAV